MALLNIPRTPWTKRKASNANEIDVVHVLAFVVEHRPEGNIEVQDFLNFVGLKATKTAVANAGRVLRNAGRKA